MLLRAFFPRIAHVFNFPHVGGLIAISPYACVFWTFANIDVNTCKYTEKHHGHGVSMFAHVVGANCNSPILQFALVTNSPTLQIAHVFNCPHVEGIIAISPYTGVIRTFANIPVNTQKRHQEHGMRVFAYVVGANCNSPLLQIRPYFQFAPIPNSPMLQFAPIPNHPYCEFTHISNLSPLQIARISNLPHCKLPMLRFTHMWKDELQFAPTRVFSGRSQICM